MKATGFLKRVVPILVLIGIVLIILTLLPFAYPFITQYIIKLFSTGDADMGVTAVSVFEVVYRILKIFLWMTLIVAFIRLINSILFSAFIKSTSYEVSTLLRNVLSAVFFIVAF